MEQHNNIIRHAHGQITTQHDRQPHNTITHYLKQNKIADKENNTITTYKKTNRQTDKRGHRQREEDKVTKHQFAYISHK